MGRPPPTRHGVLRDNSCPLSIDSFVVWVPGIVAWFLSSSFTLCHVMMLMVATAVCTLRRHQPPALTCSSCNASFNSHWDSGRNRYPRFTWRIQDWSRLSGVPRSTQHVGSLAKVSFLMLSPALCAFPPSSDWLLTGQIAKIPQTTLVISLIILLSGLPSCKCFHLPQNVLSFSSFHLMEKTISRAMGSYSLHWSTFQL